MWGRVVPAVRPASRDINLCRASALPSAAFQQETNQPMLSRIGGVEADSNAAAILLRGLGTNRTRVSTVDQCKKGTIGCPRIWQSGIREILEPIWKLEPGGKPV